MNITSFEEDLLDLKQFADRLTTFIEVEQQFVEGSLVLGLSSKFGFGKTTFLTMWKNYLLSPEGPPESVEAPGDSEEAEEQSEPPIIIELNAWESDYIGDPLFAIVSAMAKGFESSPGLKDQLIEAIKDFGWFSTAIGSQIASSLTGLDPVAAGNYAEDKKDARNPEDRRIEDAFSSFEGKKNAMSKLKVHIQALIGQSPSKVIFLVDELDRCRPDYAVSYLETIKHIFDNKGAVFILAADREQLRNATKTAFGSKLDFDEYYRKFVDREIYLPEISEVGYQRIATTYVHRYLQIDKIRSCFAPTDQSRTDDISKLIGALKLSPRQIQEVFRILGHLLSTQAERQGSLLIGLADGSVLLSILKVGKPDFYQMLAKGDLEPTKVLEFFKDILDADNVEWWFIVCLTGGAIRIEPDQHQVDVLVDVGLFDLSDKNNAKSQLTYCRWSRSRSNGLNKVYQKIEGLSNWN